MTRSVARRRSSIGSTIERESSIVSSSEIVKATTTATSTSMPRSSSPAWPVVDSPATTTPVMMLIAGRPAISLRRSGIGGRPRSAPSGSARDTSASTGRMISSMPKKRSVLA